MRQRVTICAMLFCSALLVLPVLAAAGEPKGTVPPVAKDAVVKSDTKSEGQNLNKAYVTKKEEARKRRDEAAKVREKNVSTNNPGKTGL